jgi:hypothetical protein
MMKFQNLLIGAMILSIFVLNWQVHAGEAQAVPGKEGLVAHYTFDTGNGDDYQITPNTLGAANSEFREVLRKIHRDSGDPNLHLIEGNQVLDQFSGLSVDLIHPSPAGHQMMGLNLAALLSRWGSDL